MRELSYDEVLALYEGVKEGIIEIDQGELGLMKTWLENPKNRGLQPKAKSDE